MAAQSSAHGTRQLLLLKANGQKPKAQSERLQLTEEPLGVFRAG